MSCAREIKERLAKHEPVFGITLNFVHAGMAEYLALLGFDIVVVDGEHGAVVDSSVEDVARAAQLGGAASLIRLPLSPPLIERYLGMGINGVHIPKVESCQQAHDVADATKFGPAGRRGLGGFRAASYGLTPGWPVEFKEQANDETIVMIAVEDQPSIELLPEILSVGEIDVVLIGETDLSDSMGMSGQKDHPEVRAVADSAIEMVLEAGKSVGLGVQSSPGVAAARQRGASFLLTAAAGVLKAGAAGLLADVS